jgi:hypothetical protein
LESQLSLRRISRTPRGRLGQSLRVAPDVNAPGAGIDGCTVLEAAAANGKLDFVQFLKNVGVDISETAGQYERALSLAYDHGYWALRRELLTWRRLSRILPKKERDISHFSPTEGGNWIAGRTPN